MDVPSNDNVTGPAASTTDQFAIPAPPVQSTENAKDHTASDVPIDVNVEQSPSDRLPAVIIEGKRLPEAVADTERALTLYNNPPRLFFRNGELVQIADSGGDTYGGTVLTRAIDLPHLQCELPYAARFYERTSTSDKPIYPPAILARDLMRRRGQWAPPLNEVVQIPVFGADWRLLIEPGYHAADQIYYKPNHQQLPSVAPHPTDAEVGEARRLICEELLGDFPFVGQSHRAAAVAAIIATFVRNRIDGPTPLHLADSPSAGSGKTLLADMIAAPACGRPLPADTEIANGDDLRKWITSKSLSNDPIILIDNINARLAGSALAAALTKLEWSDRIIGSSKQARGRLCAIWLATGNNVRMTKEFARRVVRCRIDAGIRQPHLRNKFRHSDLRGWAKKHRESLIWAVLTLIQNWVNQGRPDGKVILGSYEEYCRIVGGILEAADIDGFLADLDTEQRHADDETTEWVAFLDAWFGRFGGVSVGADDLDREILERYPEMLCTSLATTGTTRGRKIKLGQELRKRRDAVIGDRRIRVSDFVDRHGCWRYRLENPQSIADRPPQPEEV